MKILHTSDIHLREHGDDRWRALENLIKVGKKKKIEILVISGDLFDKGIDAESLRPKIRKVFSNNGFKIVILPGNHDSESYSGGQFYGKDTIILKDLNDPLEVGDVRIWGMPFEPVEGEKILNGLYSISDELTTDKKNVLLYHGELTDAIFSRGDFGEEGERRCMPVKLSYFKGLNIDYVLAGHFHTNFNVWEFERGKYFIYPGSPISITKRETGQRSINLFEVGKPPEDFLLGTPHYEEVVVEFDPTKEKKPLKTIEKRLKALRPEASAILKVTGFFNSSMVSMDETELQSQIEELSVKYNCADTDCEILDVRKIVEDDLFKSVMAKLGQIDGSDEEKKQLQEIAIRAMAEVRF